MLSESLKKRADSSPSHKEASTTFLTSDLLLKGLDASPVPIVVAEPADGLVVYANPAVAQRLRIPVAELQGQYTLHAPEASLETPSGTPDTEGTLSSSLLRLQDPHGRVLELCGTAQQAELGGRCWLVGSLDEEAVAPEPPRPHASQRETALLSIAGDSARLGCWSWNPRQQDGWNDEAFNQLFEIDSSQPSPERFLKRVHPKDRERVRLLMREALTEGAQQFEFELELPSGTRRVIRETARYVEVEGEWLLLGASQDITADVVKQEQLERELELRALANSNSGICSWSWNPETGAVWWDDFHFDLYEIPRGTPVTPELFLSRVAPEDQEAIRQSEAAFLTSDIREHTIEYELVLPSGTRRVVRDQSRYLKIGSEWLVLGTSQDITQEVQNRESLEREIQLRNLANENARTCSWWWNPRTDEVWWDPYHFDLYEIPREASVDQYLFMSRIYPEDHARLEAAKREPIQHGRSTIEYELNLPSGTRRVVRSHAGYFQVGGEWLVLGSTQDVTEDHLIQEMHQEQLEWMRMASELAQVGFWYETEPGQEHWDVNMRRLFQVGADEPTGFETYKSRLHPDFPQQLQRIEHNDQQARAGHAHNDIFELRLPDGTERLVRDSVGFYERHGVRRLIGVVQDITEQEQVKRSLQREKELRNLASEGIHLCYWSWKLGTDEAWWDDLHYELFEVEPGTEVTPAIFLARVHPEDRDRVSREMRLAIQEGVHTLEYRVDLPSGTQRVFRDFSRLVQFGESWLVLGTTLDVTAEVRLRDKMEEQLALINAAAEVGQLGFWSEDLQAGSGNWWSDGYQKMMQLGKEEVPCFDAFLRRLHPEDQAFQEPVAWEVDQKARKGGSHTRLYRLQLPDQSERWIRGYVSHLDFKGRQRLIGAVQDVTDQERQRQDLWEELQLHRIANEAAQVGYFKRDPATNQTWMDEVQRDIFEVRGPAWFDSDAVLSRLTPESAEKVLQSREDSLRSGMAEVELEVVSSTGNHRFIRSYQRFYPGQGRPLILGVSQDITQQLQNQEIMRRTERLSAIGQLAAEITHDMRQPLTVLEIRLGMLERSLSNKRFGDQKEHLESAQEAVRHAAAIIDRSLSLVRPQVTPQAVRMSKVVQQTLQLSHSLLGGNNLEPVFTNPWEALPGQEPSVYAKDIELTLVVQNLVVNAKEAVEARRAQEPGPNALETLHLVLESGEPGWVRLRVEDPGVGIAEEQLARLFEPLFSTKLGQHGTGLGLSMSQRIIEEHGGRIWAENRTDRSGACFFLELPTLPE